MTSRITVGAVGGGLQKNLIPTYIDNDSFPILINAIQWRGRVKRKRGTEFLTRLQRYFDSLSVSYSPISTVNLSGGSLNLFTTFSLEAGALAPGTVNIMDTTSGNNYTDITQDGQLFGNPSGTGTINYATGVISITMGASNAITVDFIYYPMLPVMGIEDFILPSFQYNFKLDFDTKYAYNGLTTQPYTAYDVSFYKNPPSGLYPGYTAKGDVTPLHWNGKNYQQFWSVNYENAFWATNGITIPFTTTNIGMQYKAVTGVTITEAGSNTGPVAAQATLTITGHGLKIGDFLFLNEIGGITGINFQTCFVINSTDGDHVNVQFPRAIIAGALTSAGIAQYLTNNANSSLDCIRWYDGDPTNGIATNPVFNTGLGWVNFSPPLSQLDYSISDLPANIYYLVGARMIFPYKDRLLFIGPVVQASGGSAPIYLQDTVIYSQNGTPYYTASWNNPTDDPRVIQTGFIQSMLVPVNQSGFPAAFLEDSTGFGGYISTNLNSQLISVSPNEDSLIIGYQTGQLRLVYSGNDINPFDFYRINSELGTSSTFSIINRDEHVITRGSRGYIATNQTSCTRIDPAIPDEVFQVRLIDNGVERFTAARDFINEWIFFSYPGNDESLSNHIFNTKTLFYNYRDNSWATIDECFTTYGQFNRRTGKTWRTIGQIYGTWSAWNVPWNDGRSSVLTPEVIGGNQQGFILARTSGTSEGTSLSILSFTGSIVNCVNHCLNQGDFIIITGCIGTIGTEINGKIFQIGAPITQNSFDLIGFEGSGTYFGNGLITRYFKPKIQTKQFPVAWGDGRKTRIGVQRYLLTKTDKAQMQLLIYLSQSSENPYNTGPIVPAQNTQNDALIYSTVLHTCPESTNIGLTPANVNLMTPTASTQAQIWHRINTSLIGDSVQLGFTISDEQMLQVTETGAPVNLTAEIELHGFILDVYPSQMLV